jgi:hypothetical protein
MSDSHARPKLPGRKRKRASRSLGPLGRELALKIYTQQFDIEAQKLLAECKTRDELDRCLHDLKDRLLQHEREILEPGLLNRVVIIEDVNGNVEISAKDGVEVSPEQIAKVRAAYKWERNVEARRAIDEHVGPMLNTRIRWWLCQFDDRSEQSSNSLAHTPITIDAQFTIAPPEIAPSNGGPVAIDSTMAKQETPAPASKRGARLKQATAEIIKAWEGDGRPWPFDVAAKDKIAEVVFPVEFRRAKDGSILRKRLRDRVGVAIHRHGRNAATQ